jgi:hypothetical protein
MLFISSSISCWYIPDETRAFVQQSWMCGNSRVLIFTLKLLLICFSPPFLSTPSLFPYFLCIKDLYIDTDGTWYIGNNGKSEEVGAKSHIRQSATPNKMPENVSKWGYHENSDILDILKYFKKSSWIRKEGWTGYIFYKLVIFLRLNIRRKAMYTLALFGCTKGVHTWC